MVATCGRDNTRRDYLGGGDWLLTALYFMYSRSLMARFGEHWKPSSTTSEVSKHIHTDSPDHTITLEDTKILTVEHKWFERGVMEVIHIRALKPSLNRDGGRYNLPRSGITS